MKSPHKIADGATAATSANAGATADDRATSRTSFRMVDTNRATSNDGSASTTTGTDRTRRIRRKP